MNCIHLNYQIDKQKYRDVFWSVYTQGQWQEMKVPRMFWWKVYGIEDLVEDVAKDLNIHGMNNFPRFAYMFKGNDLQYHLDEDYMSSICINLMDGPSPEQVIEDIPTAYECMLFENGNLFHYVESRDEDSLMLKFCIRHPWEEIYERVKRVGLCD
tara:strand:+ start:5575 stop:6039 length:465 start_codon:yes stop_codon:yes gene_type:complete